MTSHQCRVYAKFYFLSPSCRPGLLFPRGEGLFYTYRHNIDVSAKIYIRTKVYFSSLLVVIKWAATWQNKQNGMCAQRRLRSVWHLPSLIRVFAVRMKKALVLSYPLNAQRRLWSDWADAQGDLSLRWAHSHFIGFVMLRLKYEALLWKRYWNIVCVVDMMAYHVTKRVTLSDIWVNWWIIVNG